MATLHLLVILVLAPLWVHGSPGFVQKLHHGVRLAQEYFGMDSAALKVADLVLTAFQNRTVPQEPPSRQANGQTDGQASTKPEPSLGWSSLVKLLGLQGPKMSAVLLNTIIFIAQMITTLLHVPAPSAARPPPGDPSSWLLSHNSTGLRDLLSLARDDSLPSLLQREMRGDDVSCVRLFLCKMAPFVKRMQSTVFGNTTGECDKDGTSAERCVERDDTRTSVLYRYLPSRREIESHGAKCERKFRQCRL